MMWSVIDVIGCDTMSQELLGQRYDIKNNTKFYEWMEPQDCGLPFDEWKNRGISNDELVQAISDAGWSWLKWRDDTILVNRMTHKTWDDCVVFVSMHKISEYLELTMPQIKLAIIKNGIVPHRMSLANDKWYINIKQKPDIEKYLNA